MEEIYVQVCVDNLIYINIVSVQGLYKKSEQAVNMYVMRSVDWRQRVLNTCENWFFWEKYALIKHEWNIDKGGCCFHSELI